MHARGALVAQLALVMCLASATAHADPTKDQCIDANGKGQVLRRDGKFAASREQLRSCADAACPAMVRDDCAKRLDDLDAAQPSMIFDVKDAAGADVITVKVSVDGQPLTDHLEGTPLNVDPGAHTFTFEVKGHPVVTRQLLVKEGEARRQEHVIVGDIGLPPGPGVPGPATQQGATPAPSPVDSAAAQSSPGLGTQRLLALTLGGAGVVGLGVGTVFGLLSGTAWGNAKSACGGDASHCANVSSGQSFRSTAETDATVSTVAFIGGGALLVAGAALFFTAPQPEGRAGVAVRAVPSVGPGQAGVALNGVFP
jgi:hypothetical protein